MVKIQLERQLKAIKTTKRRIEHCERHGLGTNAMQEKKCLEIQKRKLEKWREEYA